jgi:hypothetical protein
MTYGELGAADNVATCALRVRWSTGERAPGCGARIALCHGCGLRTRVNGAPCGACGGTERPTTPLTAEPARAAVSEVDRTGSIAPAEPMRETVQPYAQRVEVGSKAADEHLAHGSARGSEPVAAVGPANARADVSGQGGHGSRREKKATATGKSRAARTVKPAAGHEASDLPLFK